MAWRRAHLAAAGGALWTFDGRQGVGGEGIGQRRDGFTRDGPGGQRRGNGAVPDGQDVVLEVFWGAQQHVERALDEVQAELLF